MQPRRLDPDAVGDRFQQLLLREPLVVGDVVCVTDRAWMVDGEHQSLHGVAHVDERHPVVAAADDDAPGGAQTIGHVSEVQMVAGTEDLIRADDHGGQPILGDHAAHQRITLGLGHRVGVGEGPQREALVDLSRRAHPVDARRAHVDETLDACRQRCTAHVLGTGDVDRPVVGDWPPHVHHRGEVDHHLRAPHRGDQRVRLANVAAVHRNRALLEPASLLAGKRENAHGVAAPEQCCDEVASHEAVSPDDEHLHVRRPRRQRRAGSASGTSRRLTPHPRRGRPGVRNQAHASPCR